MKKPIATVALGTLSVLLLAGCAGGPGGAAAEAPPSAKAQVKTPRPSAAQTTSLVAELAKVTPAVPAEDAVRSSEATCRFILEGRNENAQVKLTKVQFGGRNAKAMSDEDAKRIIEVVKSNGFCVTAS